MGRAIQKSIFGHMRTAKGPDRPAHTRSLIWAFTVRNQNHWIRQNARMDGKGAGVTLRVRRMN